MANTVLFPDISFDESDVGPTSPASRAGNRIGVVGEFLRGPYGVLQLLDTPDSLMRIMGKNTQNGSLAIQTAQDQGARDFGAIRVMGSPVQAGAYVEIQLGAGETTWVASGEVLLMLTGVIAPVIGNGVGTNIGLANMLAQGINASTMPIMASVTNNILSITTSNPASQELPLILRQVDPNNLLGSVTGTGVLFKDSTGTVIKTDSVFRLVNGATQITVDYDPSAVTANMTVSDIVAIANGDTVTVSIDSVSKTLTGALAPMTSITQTTAPTAGEVVTVTIAGVAESYTVLTTDTASTIFQAIINSFTTANPAFLADVSLAVSSGVFQITAKTGVAFLPLTVAISDTSTGTPTGVFTLSSTTIGPMIASVDDFVSNFVVNFATHPTCVITGSGAVLTVQPLSTTSYVSIPLTASTTSTSTDLLASWSVNALVPPTGYLKSTNIHLLVGAESSVTATIDTNITVVSNLIQSISDRGLSALAALVTNSNDQIQLTSRMTGNNGNSMLFSVIQQVAGVNAIIDPGVVIEEKSAVLGSLYAPASNAAYYAFGGGLAGPSYGETIFRKRRFVQTQAAGTLSWNATLSKVQLTFSAGAATINQTVNESVVGDMVNCPATAGILIVVDDQGNINAKLAPALNEVILGSYTITGAQSASNLGLFTPAPAVNGNHLLVVASSEGAWSSDVSVAGISNSDGSISLTATYGTLTDENYIQDSFNFNLSQSGVLDGSLPYPLVITTKNSATVQVYYMGTLDGVGDDILPATQVLTGGGNGPVVSVNDYIKAINNLANSSVNIILAPGRTEPVIQNLLLSQAAASDEISGMRIAVLSAPQKTSPSAALLLTKGVDSKFGTMVVGWATYTNRTDLAALSVPPDGFYAGHMAVTPVQASMAARTSSPAFVGISAVDTTVGTVAYNTYSQARCEAIIPDQATGVYHCLDGLSLSIDPAWKWISLRRVYNEVRAKVFAALQFGKSEPNTTSLQRRMGNTVDNILFAMQQKGQISSYTPTKADAENNPPNLVAQGLLRVDMFFSPIYPADNIGVGVHRVVPVSITVSTGQ